MYPGQRTGQPDIVPNYGSDDSRQYLGARTGGSRPTSVTPIGGQQLYFADGTPVSTEHLNALWSAGNEEDARRFDVGANYNDRSLQSLDRDRKAAVQQAKDALAEEHRQHDLTYGLDVRKQNAAELATAAGMRGPLDAFQGAEYARGIANTNGVPSYLQNLQNLQTNGTTAYGGGTATSGNPTPLTVGTLATQLGQGGSAGAGGTDAYGRPLLSPAYQHNLAAISTVAQRGLANLGQGALENLSDSERKTFISGLDYLGRDSNADMEMYRRSRPGQGSALSG